MDIALNLTLPEVNAILAILSDRPYKEVADLIHKIQAQGNPQIQPKPEPKPVESEPGKSPEAVNG